MSQHPREQQHNDARRIGRRGSGKLDTTPAASTRGPAPRDGETPGLDEVRQRLLAERQTAIEELARLGLGAERDDPSGAGESLFEEGDVAQASERLDMRFMHRERVAGRINQLTRALERVARGEYGTCEDCAGAIEPARLAAAPEVTVCRACQEQREGGRRAA